MSGDPMALSAESQALRQAIIDRLLRDGMAEKERGYGHAAAEDVADAVLDALGLEQVGVRCPFNGGRLRPSCCNYSEPVYRVSVSGSQEADHG